MNVTLCNATEGAVAPVEYAIVACTQAANCSCPAPISFVNINTIPSFWYFINYSTLLLSWCVVEPMCTRLMTLRIILPLASSYMTSGEFTVWAKMKASLKENAIIYGSIGVIAGAFLIYIVVKDHLTLYAICTAIHCVLIQQSCLRSSLMVMLISASNTWGLLLLVCLSRATHSHVSSSSFRCL